MTNQQDAANENAAPVLDFPAVKSIDTQAAEWMALLDGDAPSEHDRQAFGVWIQADPAHRRAFEEMVAFYDDMNILTQAVLPRERPQLSRRLSPRGFAGLAAASLCCWLFVVALVPMLNLNEGRVYVTEVGEQRYIDLPDGSSVLLNTNSRLSVAYGPDRRRLDLLQGEAHFEVFHNPRRPFEVYAAGGLVRAIGTAFSVHMQPLEVEVLVTEGVVEIDRAAPREARSTQVSAGNLALFDRGEGERIQLSAADEIEKRVSWHQGLLAFENDSLETVVAEVGRYTTLRIIIPERSTREIKVGGLFKAGDTEALFEALKDGFNLHVEKVSDDVVYLISSKNR
jgi:transmembrane sensor